VAGPAGPAVVACGLVRVAWAELARRVTGAEFEAA